jgi:hypothetical protein
MYIGEDAKILNFKFLKLDISKALLRPFLVKFRLLIISIRGIER